MESVVHVDDVGTVFELQMMGDTGPIDLTSATELRIVFKKPDGTLMDKAITFTTNGADGKIRYVTVAGDIDQVKKWKIQGIVTLPSGVYHSDIETFTVKPNLHAIGAVLPPLIGVTNHILDSLNNTLIDGLGNLITWV